MGFSVDGISDLYGELTPAEQGYLRSTLSQYVPSAVDDAARAVQGLGPAAQKAIQGLQSGNAVTAVESSIPLISAGLALIPGFGLAAAGVVAAGGQLFGMLADALHLGAPHEDVCSWVVGGVCFNKARPFGPSDPTWLRMERFAATTLAMNGEWHSHNEVPVVGNYASWLDVAFRSLPGWELWALGDHVSPAAKAWRDEKRLGGWTVDDATGQTDNGAGAKADAPSRVLAGKPEGDFLMTFYRAYVHSLEFVLNGYQQPDPYSLLLATAAAFNRTHSSHSTFTFDGQGSTFLDSLLSGGIDGLRKPPVTINTGPRVITLHLGAVPPVNPITRLHASLEKL